MPLVSIRLGPLLRSGIVVQVVPSMAATLCIQTPSCFVDRLSYFVPFRFVPICSVIVNFLDGSLLRACAVDVAVAVAEASGDDFRGR